MNPADVMKWSQEYREKDREYTTAQNRINRQRATRTTAPTEEHITKICIRLLSVDLILLRRALAGSTPEQIDAMP